MRDVFIGEGFDCGVVCYDNCGRLRVAEGLKYVPEWETNLGIVEAPRHFGFCGGSDNMAECLTLNQDGGAKRVDGVCAKSKVSGDTAAGFRSDKVSRVGVDC